MSNSSQYVAVMAGFGGGGGFAFAPDTAAYQRGNEGRIVALTVGGGPVPKPAAVTDLPFPQPPAAVGPPATVTHGEVSTTATAAGATCSAADCYPTCGK